MHSYQKILVPIDGSLLSKMAFEQAISLARMVKGEVHITHVLEHPILEPIALYGQDIMTAAELIQRETKGQSKLMIEELIGTIDHKGVHVTIDIREGPVSSELIEMSKDYDIVIMGTQGRNILTSLFLGGVAEKVVRHAYCPVMLIREKMKKD